MTKIATLPVYEIKDILSPNDYFIGTNSQTEQLETVNFMFDSVKKFVLGGLSPEFGGSLQITEIVYTGEAFANATALVNAMNPTYTVGKYHLVVVSVNGVKSLLKLQDRVIGLDKTPVTANDFILFPTSVGLQGNAGKGIVSILKTATVGLVDTYKITYSDESFVTYTVTNGTTGANSVVPGPNGNGITTIAKTNTAGLTDTYTITFTNGTTTTFTVTNGSNGTNSVGTTVSNNLQRDESVSFMLADTDNNYVIQLKNAGPITVIIPTTGLRTKFNVGFVRLGVGEVSFVGDTGVTVQNPVGFRINRQFDPCYIERDGNTQNYPLYGNTKI